MERLSYEELWSDYTDAIAEGCSINRKGHLDSNGIYVWSVGLRRLVERGYGKLISDDGKRVVISLTEPPQSEETAQRLVDGAIGGDGDG